MATHKFPIGADVYHDAHGSGKVVEHGWGDSLKGNKNLYTVQYPGQRLFHREPELKKVPAHKLKMGEAVSRKDRYKLALTETKSKSVHVLHIHPTDSDVYPFELAKYHGATHSQEIGGDGREAVYNHTFPSHQHAHEFATNVEASGGKAFHNRHPQAAKGRWHQRYLGSLARKLKEQVGHIEKGAFHRWLGKSEDQPITAADIAKGKAAGGHAAKMAVFAQNFGHHKESYSVRTPEVKTLKQIKEGLIGPTRMDLQKHYDKLSGLTRARIRDTEQAHGVSDIKVNASGTITSFRHPHDTKPVREHAEHQIYHEWHKDVQSKGATGFTHSKFNETGHTHTIAMNQAGHVVGTWNHTYNQGLVESVIAEAFIHYVGKAHSSKTGHKYRVWQKSVAGHHYIMDKISARDKNVKGDVITHHDSLDSLKHKYGLTFEALEIVNTMDDLKPILENMDEARRYDPFSRSRHNTMKTGPIKDHPWVGKKVQFHHVERAADGGVSRTSKTGTVLRVSREPTFSQMVPYVTKVHVQDESGTSHEVRKHMAKLVKEETVNETRMPAGVIEQKQKYGMMTDQELAHHFKHLVHGRDKSVAATSEAGQRSIEHAARTHAWRHGYGKMSGHYWDRIKKHLNESVELDERARGVQHFTNHADWHDAAETHGGEGTTFKIQNAGGRTIAISGGKEVGRFDHEKKTGHIAESSGGYRYHIGDRVKHVETGKEGTVTRNVPHENGVLHHVQYDHGTEAHAASSLRLAKSRKKAVMTGSLSEAKTSKNKMKRKYLGKSRGRTKVGTKAHGVDTDPTLMIKDNSTLKTISRLPGKGS